MKSCCFENRPLSSRLKLEQKATCPAICNFAFLVKRINCFSTCCKMLALPRLPKQQLHNQQMIINYSHEHPVTKEIQSPKKRSSNLKCFSHFIPFPRGKFHVLPFSFILGVNEKAADLWSKYESFKSIVTLNLLKEKTWPCTFHNVWMQHVLIIRLSSSNNKNKSLPSFLQ